MRMVRILDPVCVTCMHVYIYLIVLVRERTDVSNGVVRSLKRYPCPSLSYALHVCMCLSIFLYVYVRIPDYPFKIEPTSV